MYSELLRIPIEWAGVPIFGMGILLACLLVGSGIGLAIEGRKKGWSTSVWSYLPGFGLAVAAILMVPKIFPEGLPIRGYGAMMLAGSVTAIWLAVRRAQQVGFDPEQVFSLAFWLFIGGVLGARLFYLIEYWNQPQFQAGDWWSKLKQAVNFTEGGLVVYGSLIGGTLAFVIFVRRHRLPALAWADLIAPSLMIGLAFGRIGCLLNGCCYGGESQHAWAIRFPQENSPGHLSAPFAEQASRGRFHGFQLAPQSESLSQNSAGERKRLEKSRQSARSEAYSQRPQVTKVDADSPAERAGLQVGEIVTHINGQRVETVAQAEYELFENTIKKKTDKSKSMRLRTLSGQERTLEAIRLPSRSLPIHPTQIYSAIHAALLGWLLWSYFPFRRHEGEVAALMLTIYPISRFLLEKIRIDESAVFGTGLSISQNISVVIFLAAITFWGVLWRQPQQTAKNIQ